MKHTLKLLATAIVAILIADTTACGWTKREHAAIALIAEQNLSPKALKAVSEILEGRSISSYASWLDYYREDMIPSVILGGNIPSFSKMSLIAARHSAESQQQAGNAAKRPDASALWMSSPA